MSIRLCKKELEGEIKSSLAVAETGNVSCRAIILQIAFIGVFFQPRNRYLALRLNRGEMDDTLKLSITLD